MTSLDDKPQSGRTNSTTSIATMAAQDAQEIPGALGNSPGTDTDLESAPAPPPTKEEVAPQRTKFQTALIVMSLCLGMFLAALDSTIITTAIPTISAQFNSTLGYTWIGSAYLLSSSASVPSWGKVSDIWGRKPILLIAASVFWIGSLIAAISRSMGMLIAARAIQGIGGGGVVVLVNICIGDLFSMRERGMYYGIMGMVWAVAGALGPVLGGVFTNKVSWRWCFYVNLPVSGLAILVLALVLKLHNPRTPVREGLAAVDWAGSVTIIGGTLMFLLGLQFGGVVFPWASPTVICLLVFGVITVGLFVLNEVKWAKYPVIPMRLFRNPSNIASLAVCACHGYVFISGSYWLPLYFQSVLSASSLNSGIWLLPYAVSLAIMSSSTGIFLKKTGIYLPVIIGSLVVMTLGFGLFVNLPANFNWAKIICYQLVAGIGVGPNFQSPLIALQNQVQQRDMAAATATFAFIRQLFTSISVVIGGVVFQNEMQKQAASLAAAVGAKLASKFSGKDAAASAALAGSLQGEDGTTVRAAYAEGIRTMYIMYVSFAALGLVVSLFIRSKKLSKDHTEHRTGLKGMREATGAAERREAEKNAGDAGKDE